MERVSVLLEVMGGLVLEAMPGVVKGQAKGNCAVTQEMPFPSP